MNSKSQFSSYGYHHLDKYTHQNINPSNYTTKPEDSLSASFTRCASLQCDSSTLQGSKQKGRRSLRGEGASVQSENSTDWLNFQLGALQLASAEGLPGSSSRTCLQDASRSNFVPSRLNTSLPVCSLAPPEDLSYTRIRQNMTVNEEQCSSDESRDVSMMSWQSNETSVLSPKEHNVQTFSETDSKTMSTSIDGRPFVSCEEQRSGHSVCWTVCFVLGSCIMAALAVFVYLTTPQCYSPDSVSLVHKDLKQQVLGQPLALDLLQTVLESFLDTRNSDATLVLSFHGWTGVGKNLVASIIASHLVRSSSVSTVFVPVDFPTPAAAKSDHYARMRNILSRPAHPCPVRVVILDEVDKADKDARRGLVDGIQLLQNTQQTKTLVFLLTNAGGHEINQYVYKHLMDGEDRASISLKSLQESIVQSTSPAVQFIVQVADHVVPFLPLEKSHVEHCVRVYLNSTNRHLADDQIVSIVNTLPYYYVSKGPVFSKSGCKKVAAKVSLHFV